MLFYVTVGSIDQKYPLIIVIKNWKRLKTLPIYLIILGNLIGLIAMMI